MLLLLRSTKAGTTIADPQMDSYRVPAGECIRSLSNYEFIERVMVEWRQRWIADGRYSLIVMRHLPDQHIFHFRVKFT